MQSPRIMDVLANAATALIMTCKPLAVVCAVPAAGMPAASGAGGDSVPTSAAPAAGAAEAVATDREPLALECALRSAAASGLRGVQPPPRAGAPDQAGARSPGPAAAGRPAGRRGGAIPPSGASRVAPDYQARPAQDPGCRACARHGHGAGAGGPSIEPARGVRRPADSPSAVCAPAAPVRTHAALPGRGCLPVAQRGAALPAIGQARRRHRLFAHPAARRDALAGRQVRAVMLDWADTGGADLPRFDLVLACDVLYEVRSSLGRVGQGTLG